MILMKITTRSGASAGRTRLSHVTQQLRNRTRALHRDLKPRAPRQFYHAHYFTFTVKQYGPSRISAQDVHSQIHRSRNRQYIRSLDKQSTEAYVLANTINFARRLACRKT